jgi:hypothetical protein
MHGRTILSYSKRSTSSIGPLFSVRDGRSGEERDRCTEYFLLQKNKADTFDYEADTFDYGGEPVV